MKYVALNSDGVSRVVIEDLVKYTCELDKFTYEKSDGEIGTLSGYAVGYCLINDDIDPNSVTASQVTDFLKPYKITSLQTDFDLVVEGGFIYTNGDQFSFGYEQQNEFYQKQSLLLLNPLLSSVQVLTKNNGIKDYSKEEFINLITFANQFKDEQTKKIQMFVNQIKTTTYASIQELKEIKFENENA